MTWLRDRFVAIAAIACLCGYVYAYTAGRAGTPIRSDAFSTFPDPGATPMVVTFSVDDVRAARVLLTDEAWKDVVIPMPPRGLRRVRRIDVRTSITREDNHGVKMGEVQVIRAAASAKATASQGR